MIFMEEKSCTKFRGGLIGAHEFMKLQGFNFAENEIPVCSLHVFVSFMEKESFTQFYGSFDHFS